MTLNSVRKQKRIKGKAIVPLALNDVDAERTVSHESAKSDAPGDREVGSLADLVDEVGVEQDAQPEEEEEEDDPRVGGQWRIATLPMRPDLGVTPG